jgi:hypothetical protein
MFTLCVAAGVLDRWTLKHPSSANGAHSVPQAVSEFDFELVRPILLLRAMTAVLESISVLRSGQLTGDGFQFRASPLPD